MTSLRWARLAGIAILTTLALQLPLAQQPAPPTRLLHPPDFRYAGAFLLPEGDEFTYSSGVKAYHPDGDPAGASDGFPGSLFGVAHDWWTRAFEVDIPRPVHSGRVEDLPVARLLQTPASVLGAIGLAGDELEGFEFLPRQPGQTNAALHVTFGQHYQYERRPTHGWIDLDLSNPTPAGPWYVGAADQVNDLNTNEYVFSIPERWARQHVGGMRLASGRHREGQEASGPSVIAYAPWTQGNPPSPGSTLTATPLLLYKKLSQTDALRNHCEADNWTGGAWPDHAGASAVLIVGTKGQGNCWYGWQDGTTPEACAAMPGGCEPNGYGGADRGYFADSFSTTVLFFDPDDLARVAAGTMQSHEPQPYATLDITPFMIQPTETYEIATGGIAYDAAGGHLFVTERCGHAEAWRPVVHVWRIAPTPLPEESRP